MVVKNDRWVKRWQVPKSTGDGTWTVAVDKNGDYGCSCPVWKFKRQECHHIKLVKMGGGALAIPENRPEYVLASVLKPIVKDGQLLCPLVAIPDAAMMEVTICYYLLKNGYSMGEVRELRGIPRDWSGKAIMEYIERHGEAEYPPTWYEWGQKC